MYVLIYYVYMTSDIIFIFFPSQYIDLKSLEL